MAIYRLSVKVGSRGSGRAHFDYIYGDGKYKRIGTEDDIRLTHSIDLPTWSKSPRDFWKEEEKAQDGFRKIELALPVELEQVKQNQLVTDFVEYNLKDYPCSYAIHDSKDGKNPHVHIMFSERKIDRTREEPTRENYFKKSRTRKDGSRSGGYAKDTKIIKGAGRKEWLLTLRKDWEIRQNKYLEKANTQIRVDCRSLVDQGITDRVPQIHVGVKAWRMRERSDRYQDNQAIIQGNDTTVNLIREQNRINQDYQLAQSEAERIEQELLHVRLEVQRLSIAEKKRENYVREKRRKGVIEKLESIKETMDLSMSEVNGYKDETSKLWQSVTITTLGYKGMDHPLDLSSDAMEGRPDDVRDLFVSFKQEIENDIKERLNNQILSQQQNRGNEHGWSR